MAEPAKFGSEFFVPTTYIDKQELSKVATFSDGGFVVSWTDNSQTGDDTSGSAVRAQLFNADGSKSGGEILVNTTTGGDQKNPRIATLDNGDFVVTWWDENTAQTDSPVIRAQIFDRGGAAVGGELQVNTNPTGGVSDYYGAVTGLSAGNFVVTWQDQQVISGARSRDIRGQMFNADGSKSGGDFLVNTSTAYYQEEGSVAQLSGGRFVVVWRDWSQAGIYYAKTDIRAQIFNADGSKSGGEIVVNAEPDVVEDARVAALADGGFVAAWTDGVSTDVRVQVFNADGSKAGAEFQANTVTEGYQYFESVAGLKDGRFVVSWSEERETGEDTSRTGVYAQVFNTDGSKSGGEFLVNTTILGWQYDSSISGLADGRFVVSWTDSSAVVTVPDDLAIRAQIFDPREAAVTLDGTVRADDFVGTGFGDTMSGKKGADSLSGRGGADTLSGGKGKDTLMGDGGRDKVSGGEGNDKLFGGAGNDRLFGNSGKDKLNGGAGNDKMTGGAGKDVQTGGAGADTFVFSAVSDSGKSSSARDVIRDFKQSQGDLIDLSRIDAGPQAGDQAFTFVGTAGFSGTAGELRYSKVANKTIIRADVDGDGVADLSIQLSGRIDLTADDFIL